MDQPGKVANPARGQLNRKNEHSPVPVRASEFGLARRVQPSRPASACSFSILRLNMMLTYGIPPEFLDGLYKNGMAISPTGGVFSYLPHHLDLASEDSVRHKQYMHECVGASQSCHGVYRAAQTVLSRCCHGYSGIPTPMGQKPYLPHRQEPTNHPTANPNPNPPTTP